MANGNMGAPGKGAANPVDLVKPVADVAQRASKAGKIKSIKLKIKMQKGQQAPAKDGS